MRQRRYFGSRNSESTRVKISLSERGYDGISDIAGRKYLKWDVPWISLFRKAFATGFMSLGLYLVDKVSFGGVLGLLLVVIIGTLVYGGLLLALRELQWSELRTIYRYALRKMGSVVPWIDLD